MKSLRLAGVLTVALVFAVGCGSMPGVSHYRRVDLNADLDASTLARYRGEVDSVRSAGQAGHSVQLERTNWWPLGLVVYWQQGAVRAMDMPGGERRYMVSSSHGVGPLSLFYVTERSAAYGADGRRLMGSAGTSLLWGHLAMSHRMESRDPKMGWQRQHSVHFLHHLINWGAKQGRPWVSLFSAPNPAGVGQ